MIEVWNPKWKTHEVLIACHKVSRGMNHIRFTKCKALPYVYEVSYEDIIDCPIINNGKIDCYAVPLALLKVSKHSTLASRSSVTNTDTQVLQSAT